MKTAIVFGRSVTLRKPRRVRGTRYYNLRLISEKRSYTMQEIADLYGISVRTVGRWLQEGKLLSIDGRKPYLFHGTQVKACCAAINMSFKKNCAEGELYCFGCKKGRSPLNREVTITADETGRLRLVGKCGVCGISMYRLTNEAGLFKYRRMFILLQHGGEDRKECSRPCYHEQLKQGAEI